MPAEGQDPQHQRDRRSRSWRHCSGRPATGTSAWTNTCGGCANRPNTLAFRAAMRPLRRNWPPWPRGCRPRRTRSVCWLPATARSLARPSRSSRGSFPIRSGWNWPPGRSTRPTCSSITRQPTARSTPRRRPVAARATTCCSTIDRARLRRPPWATSWSAAARSCGRRRYLAACWPGPTAPDCWPKARSASAWFRWKCFPSATNCSSSTPCGCGGRRGLSVRATLDQLPQDFGNNTDCVLMPTSIISATSHESS